jgi:pilus assembly protein CpaB
MRARTLLLFVVALLLAGGTAVMVRSRLETPAATVAVSRPAATPQKAILVARAAIDRGAILKAPDLGWQAWPEAAITQAYVVENREPAGTFTGWVALQPFVAGEPIIKSQIIAPGDRGFLAAVLPPGMRAVSVPVNTTSGIAGFIFPGDRVDVLVTHPLPTENTGPQLGRKAAETVLHDVRVIAIDQRLDAKPGQAMLAHTVTLEVTPKQSEILALASDLGQLSLSLRSLVAKNGAASDGQSAAAGDSFTLDSDVSRLIADDQITIIRGGSRSTSATDAVSAARGD